jgi:TPR repeat protein
MSNFTELNKTDTDDFESLEEIEECYDFSFDENDKQHTNLILSIFNEKIKPTSKTLSESKDGFTEYIFGLYYDKEEEDDDKMVKYYKMAAEKGNVVAMYELGHFYDENEDTNNMIKYYSMGVEHGDIDSMCNLGCHYQDLKDYPNMLKYWSLAIEKGDSGSMNNMANYYDDINDDENALKYWLMAVEKGDTDAMNNIALYYQNKEQNDRAIEYYNMAIALLDDEAMYNLGSYYEEEEDSENMLKYWNMAAENENVDAMLSLTEYYKKQIYLASDDASKTNSINNMLKYALMFINLDDENFDDFQNICKNVFKNYHYVMYTELSKLRDDDMTEFIENKIKTLKKKIKKNKTPHTYDINNVGPSLGRKRNDSDSDNN